MAQPDIVRGTYVSLMLGNGADPEVFTALCGINTRDFTEQVNTNDVFTLDCADPEDVPIRRLIPTGKQWDLSGSGQLNRAQLASMQAASGVTRNWRFVLDEPTADPVFGGYYAGPAMLTTLRITGEDGDFVNVELTIASDGEWAWTTVA